MVHLLSTDQWIYCYDSWKDEAGPYKEYGYALGFRINFTPAFPFPESSILHHKKEVFMYVRLAFFKLLPGKSREVRKIYNDQIIPSLKRQKGNLVAHLMEPTNKSDDFISVTQWKTRADAQVFESSARYEKLLKLVEPFITKDPVTRNYLVEEEHVTKDAL